ncbi:arylsulfatase [Thalassotalea atypica]|uniref:arylsulfatase n=1 Tax=Thalassotalea atypica TaxID=2054316 RepID=UPI002573F6FD|nr:arylsulfatase [Thalassotalea atypica]
MKKSTLFTALGLLVWVNANAFANSTEILPNNADMQAKKRPNIIVILADDMGYSDIAPFGSEIDTPVLSELAANGLQMTNFHVGAACSPTRTMLMSGVDNHLAGLGNMLEIQADNQFGKPGYEGKLNHNVVSLPTILKGSGYHTYMVGKWHLGKKAGYLPADRGFERDFTLMESGADNYVNKTYAPMYKQVHYFEDGKPADLPKDGEYFSTDYYTEKMISYIDSNKDSGKPFFAYVAYQAVHSPVQAPKQYIDKYDGVYDQGWDALKAKRLAKQKELGIVGKNVGLRENMDNDIFEILDWDSLSEEEKQFSAHKMQTYAGMVDNMDVNIGRLMKYLESIGEADNTMIIFMSDNGGDPTELPDIGLYTSWYEDNYQYTFIDDYSAGYSEMGQNGSFVQYGPGWASASNTPGSFWKTFSSEGGIRSPMIAYFPDHIKAQRSAEFGFIKDVVPTLLDVANIDIDETYAKLPNMHKPDGVSMWSLMTGKSATVHPKDAKVGYELAGSSAVFYGDYKAVRNIPPKGNGEWELYNIKTDPAEANNLASKKPELIEELANDYAQYVQDNGVIEVPKGYDPRIQLVKNSMQDNFFIYWTVTVYAWFKGLFA